MYIHIGQNTAITDKEIIGIFDLESTTVSKITRDYLKINEKKKNVYYVSAELPRSFVVCEGRRIFVSHLSSGTISKRGERGKEQLSELFDVKGKKQKEKNVYTARHPVSGDRHFILKKE